MAGQIWSTLVNSAVESFQGLVQTNAVLPPVPPPVPASVAAPVAASVQDNSVETALYYSLGVQDRFPAELFEHSWGLPQAQVTQYADIKYEYDEQKHIERTQARLRAGNLKTDLPEGWPKVLSGPQVWNSSDYQDESLFVYHLSDLDRAEIRDALEHFKGEQFALVPASGARSPNIDQSLFPLPNLGKTLANIRTDLYNGRGFATLRGLDVDGFSSDDVATVYLGLTSYVAEKRGKQNQAGVMMINVVNTGEEVERENSEVLMPFHTDLVCDTLTMLTLSCGSSGGSGIIASAWTVYNELAATRPDLIHVLAEPNWPFDTHGRNPPYYLRALLHFEDGKLITNFSRRLLVGQNTNGPRTSGIPGLTEAQAEALDALHAIGRRHEIKQSMMKGDIRFLNNLALMHRRDTFTDNTDDHRHLLRLWLHNDALCWKLPVDLQLAWERVFNDRERQEEWHFVKFSHTNERYVAPLWDDRSERGGNPRPPQPPPPVTICD